jgi:tetratricopeptide (TPR) repeat protein
MVLNKNMRKSALFLAIGIPLALLVAVLIYNLPPVHERLAWRVEALRSQIQYALNPPEQVVFVPQATSLEPPAASPSPLPTIAPTATTTQPGPTPTPQATPTPQPTSTPLPGEVMLTGITHEYQKWNNCGPANLSMALSYWDWPGTQLDTAAVLKPNPRDKNVMPYEMASFVEEHTGLKAIVRLAGDLELLKALISAGFPVVIEKGFEGANFDGWMGHYEVVSGYDDAQERFTVQDSYIMANLPVPYAEMEAAWRAFNYTYIVIYPLEREAEVQAILGPQWDEIANYQTAAERASEEVFNSSGRDLYFAWFNRGTSLMYLQDYNGAAAAFDEAFVIYPEIEQKARPWRMMWYQTGPYFAYFFTQRYYDVINLATTTIDTATEPAIEESFYWRARAFYALYELEGKPEYLAHAEEDLRASLKWHPNFGPTLGQMQILGMVP